MNLARSLALCGLLLLPACVDYARVARIVEESNGTLMVAEIDRETGWRALSSEVPGDVQLPATTSDLDARRADTIARIDEYAARHPDQPVVVNALRMRKAFLLLASGRPNLARLAFQEVDPGALRNERDLALHRAHETLVWWWTVAPIREPARCPPDPEFEEHARRLRTLVCELPPSPARSYLGLVRALLVLKRVRIRLEGELARAALQEGLNTYSALFDERARDHIRAYHRSDQDPGPARDVPLEEVRWYAPVKSVYGYYVETARAGKWDIDHPDHAWMKGL